MSTDEAAYWLAEQLKEQRLDVARIGHLRVVQSSNPDWYSELCDRYKKRRKRYPKLRTIIKRCHVLRTLGQFIEGQNPTTVYAERLLPFIERMQ